MRSSRLLRVVAIVVVALLLAIPAVGYLALHSSLPQIDGTLTAEQTGEAAAIERDAEGSPVIRAHSRKDLAFATGFAHAQDRYFQMDLMRRAAAGELAELLG